MDSGVAYFPTHDSVGPAQIAKLVEERGHRWLMFTEHTHIPASRETPWGGREGAPPLPRKYACTYDPFVACTAALMATSSLRVGTGICLVTERDPLITAKEVSSVDHLSGGRFDFGIGAGWNREELANHGTDPRKRMAVMRERVLAMKEIWANHESTFHGEYVNFDAIWSDPKPLQRPHPPILVGGTGKTVTDRVLEYGDGWMPTHQRDIVDRIPRLLEEAGRPLEVIVMGPPMQREILQAYADAGTDRAMFWLPSTRMANIEDELDRIERAMAELNGTD